ncbi:outer membrane protein [Bartonella sp. A05]|uniref:outer membrane protein n=1 Tax=Bartonella sp. A05 TaxID=2967261 RepID=UPI0022A9B12B|nr:outer membrane protein [Bartonella sp. A05]MCZ2203346.1 porin family protein [Bartonella sp. A05]
MNMKCLITASIFALVSTSAVWAADIITPQQSELFIPQVIVDPGFSWSGFYFGGQIGGFSSKSKMNVVGEELSIPVGKDLVPKLSGFTGGLYAGSNVDVGSGLILGVDTDMVWVGRKNTKTVTYNIEDGAGVGIPGVGVPGAGVPGVGAARVVLPGYGIPELTGWPIPAEGVARVDVPGVGGNQEDKFRVAKHTLKQKWSGATRMRIGFTVDRIMPYVAGGVAYTRLRDILSESREGKEESSPHSLDETKTLIGYTLGAGVNLAMTDNIIMRAEYRYSDFGKKKFAKDKLDLSYKTNDFRLGLAYKF